MIPNIYQREKNIKPHYEALATSKKYFICNFQKSTTEQHLPSFF